VAEVVPAAAELLEDAEPEVEAAARTVLQAVHESTGEDVEALVKGRGGGEATRATMGAGQGAARDQGLTGGGGCAPAPRGIEWRAASHS